MGKLEDSGGMGSGTSLRERSQQRKESRLGSVGESRPLTDEVCRGGEKVVS